MRIEQALNGNWMVIGDDGEAIAEGFTSNAEAWKWFDRQDSQSVKDENARRNIRTDVQKKWF